MSVADVEQLRSFNNAVTSPVYGPREVRLRAITLWIDAMPWGTSNSNGQRDVPGRHLTFLIYWISEQRPSCEAKTPQAVKIFPSLYIILICIIVFRRRQIWRFFIGVLINISINVRILRRERVYIPYTNFRVGIYLSVCCSWLFVQQIWSCPVHLEGISYINKLNKLLAVAKKKHVASRQLTNRSENEFTYFNRI